MFNDILQAISTVGFPITFCLILCYYIYNTNKTNNDTIDKVTKALNNNTIALNKLSERVTQLEKQ